MTDTNEKVQNVELTELEKSQGSNDAIFSGKRLDLIQNVKVKVTAVMGESEISVSELFNLKEDSILKLDQDSNTPIKIMLDDKIIAKGSLVVVDDNFGVQISDVVKE
ncbi:MAG: hypothetical protein D6B28_00225 [Gammaproteobacteria bacterium]|nr:MAG: hypothetical protein D6B28_00225 [Gammaproteobacteria bacterium]